MLGKLFLLAVVSVLLVQVRGDKELEKEIERGLMRAEDIFRTARDEIEDFRGLVNRTKEDIGLEIVDLEYRVAKDKEEIKNSLANTAESTREKARESHDPASVVQCVNRLEDEAHKRFKELYDELSKQVVEFARTTLEDIAIFIKPMQGIEKNLNEKRQGAVKAIKTSKDVRSVNSAVWIFKYWVNEIRTDISWLIRDIAAISADYAAQMYDYSGKYRMEMTNTKSLASRNIRKCVIDGNTVMKLIFKYKK